MKVYHIEQYRNALIPALAPKQYSCVGTPRAVYLIFPVSEYNQMCLMQQWRRVEVAVEVGMGVRDGGGRVGRRGDCGRGGRGGGDRSSSS